MCRDWLSWFREASLFPRSGSFKSNARPIHHHSLFSRSRKLYQFFYIMARTMDMDVDGLFHPPCNDDCPCRQRQLLFSEDCDDEWKPCLLVRSIQGCYFSSVYVCGGVCNVVRHPKETVQAVPARSWRFLHDLVTSKQGKLLMSCLSTMFKKINGAAGVVIPTNPPVKLDDDQVLHLLLTLYDVPAKSVRRLYEAIVNTIDTLNNQYIIEKKVLNTEN